MSDLKDQDILAKDVSRPGTVFNVDIEDPKKRVQAYLDCYRGDNRAEGFDEALLRDHLILISANAQPKASAVFEMTITPAFCNRMKRMHGGAVALVFDMCTTMCAAPLSRRDFWWFGGVTRTLSITYLRPVTMGVQVVIECEVLQMGKRLATIRGLMKDKIGGRILAVAEHNKASVPVHTESKM